MKLISQRVCCIFVDIFFFALCVCVYKICTSAAVNRFRGLYWTRPSTSAISSNVVHVGKTFCQLSPLLYEKLNGNKIFITKDWCKYKYAVIFTESFWNLATNPFQANLYYLDCRVFLSPTRAARCRCSPAI